MAAKTTNKSSKTKSTSEAKTSAKTKDTWKVESKTAPVVEDKSRAEAKRALNLYKWRRRMLICGTLLGACALIVILVLLLQMLSTPVSIILWTIVIVFLLRGIVNGLDNKGCPRAIGTLIAYLIMFAVIVLLFLFMFSPAFGLDEQIKNLIQQAPVYIKESVEWARDVYSHFSGYIENDAVQAWFTDAASGIANIGSSIASSGVSGLLSFGAGIGNSLMAIGIALVIAFWILMQLPAIGREAKRYIKPKYEQDCEMWHYTFTHVMSGYIKGTFIQCAIIGILAGLLYWALGLGNSAALGTITGVLNIIPIIGPWIGGVVAALAGIFVSPLKAVVAVGGTIVIQQVVYTFVSPKIMSSAVDIHPALTLFALTVGGAVGGVTAGTMGSLVGMLLSIPFVAVFKSMFVYYYEKRTGRRVVAEDGVFFKGIPVGDDTAKPMVDAVAPSPAVIKQALSSKRAMREFSKRWDISQKDLKQFAFERKILDKEKLDKNMKTKEAPHSKSATEKSNEKLAADKAARKSDAKK